MVVSIAIACLPVLPQTQCGSPGPDLVIGDIVDVANYASEGLLDACYLGFSACNVGSVPVDYEASTSAHPVYGCSLYRLEQNEGAVWIRQIGQGWLKHGAFPLQQDFCCTCTPTGGSELGAGCTDSFSTSGGVSVSELGPRWQVDAATGSFPFPPANRPHSGLDRLLQAHVGDLQPTGALRYFVEVHAVAADDAAAGNKDNNSSHRQVLVTGSGTEWTFSLTGSTQREQPAIYAWQDADSSGVVSEVDVPGDGRFLLASRAVDIGGGNWLYQYVLHNQSSDRSARSFSVVLPVNGTAWEPRFYDVDYHSGDGPGDVNFDDDDWTWALINGVVGFGTDSYSVNPNANALRWGTTYNIRFRANFPPGAGSATIGLFKPGSPASVSIAAVVPLGDPPPPHFPRFCFGNGGSGPCPCGNTGGFGRGCQNSAGTGGASLTGSGNASLFADSLVLTSGGELPTALSIVMQGDLTIPAVSFGDGLRCTGGTLKRLYVKTASGGGVTVPQPGDPSVSARSAELGDPISPGESRNYQTYYRDANLTFCPAPQGSTFNVTGAVGATWQN